MNSTFYIGDSFMVSKKTMMQTVYGFIGAKKLDGANKWEISVQSILINGYAGGSSIAKWEVELNEEFRVSGHMRGYVTVEGLNKEKIKEKQISAVKFVQIEKDKICVEFVL